MPCLLQAQLLVLNLDACNPTPLQQLCLSIWCACLYNLITRHCPTRRQTLSSHLGPVRCPKSPTHSRAERKTSCLTPFGACTAAADASSWGLPSIIASMKASLISKRCIRQVGADACTVCTAADHCKPQYTARLLICTCCHSNTNFSSCPCGVERACTALIVHVHLLGSV